MSKKIKAIIALLLMMSYYQNVAGQQHLKKENTNSVTLQPINAYTRYTDSKSKDTDKQKIEEGSTEGSTAIISNEDIYDNNKKIIAEVAVFTDLSNVDVNRIVCNDGVKDVIYSKEKNVTVKIVDNNIFVKFIIQKENNKEKKATKPTEFYIVCGEKVYNLIAMPKSIPSQTIRLGDNKINNIKTNAEIFKGMPFEKKISKLIKILYTNNIPESFAIENINQKIELYKNLEIDHLRKIKIEGEGITVDEFTAKNISSQNIELKETDFLKPVIADKIVAIAIADPTLTPNALTRIFIVNIKTGEANE